MLLQQLSLYNFRNYGQLELACHPQSNLLIGENGQGKSNLIEAIWYLGRAASYRGSPDEQLIRWGEEGFRIQGEIASGEWRRSIETRYFTGHRKEVRVGGEKAASLRKLPGLFPVVLFSPEDLELVKGAPARRRQYLDETLSLLFPLYLENLVRYRRAVTQRNSLLRLRRPPNRETETEIGLWEQLLSQHGARLLAFRLLLLSRLADSLRRFHRLMSGSTGLEIIYRSALPNLRLESFASLPAGAAIEYNMSQAAMEIEPWLQAGLHRQRPFDQSRGATSVGPHRDELLLRWQGKEVRAYSSQGQQRAIALAMRLTQLELLDQGLQEKPVLLLDDVFSELDDRRRKNLLTILSGERQVFITATGREQLPGIAGEGACWQVSKGKLTPVRQY